MKKLLVFLSLFLMSGVAWSASYKDLMVIAHNPVFLDRVKYAMQGAAINVMAEDPGTASHDFRLLFARTILQGKTSVEEYAIGVVNNGTIATEADVTNANQGFSIPDTDIQFVVNSEFNAFAGVGQ